MTATYIVMMADVITQIKLVFVNVTGTKTKVSKLVPLTEIVNILLNSQLL
jgi:hypothetical protein